MKDSDAESPAKKWQVTSLEKRIEMQESFNTKIYDKLDVILVNQITAKQFEERMAAVTKMYDEKLEGAIEKVHLRYGPLADNVKWLVRATIGGVIGIIVQTAFILINVYGGK